MRRELAGVLEDLEPHPSGQLQIDGTPSPPTRPAIADRIRLWDLAIKLGRELGTEVDPPPATDNAPEAPRPRRRAPEFG